MYVCRVLAHVYTNIGIYTWWQWKQWKEEDTWSTYISPCVTRYASCNRGGTGMSNWINSLLNSSQFHPRHTEICCFVACVSQWMNKFACKECFYQEKNVCLCTCWCTCVNTCVYKFISHNTCIRTHTCMCTHWHLHKCTCAYAQSLAFAHAFKQTCMRTIFPSLSLTWLSFLQNILKVCDPNHVYVRRNSFRYESWRLQVLRKPFARDWTIFVDPTGTITVSKKKHGFDMISNKFSFAAHLKSTMNDG